MLIQSYGEVVDLTQCQAIDTQRFCEKLYYQMPQFTHSVPCLMSMSYNYTVTQEA